MVGQMSLAESSLSCQNGSSCYLGLSVWFRLPLKSVLASRQAVHLYDD